MKKTIYENVVIRTSCSDNGKYKEFESTKYIDEEKAIDLISDIDAGNDFATQCTEIFKRIQERREAKYTENHLEFVYDTALLVAGKHIDNRVKIIPARAGFGKSTAIYSIISAVIRRIKEGTWKDGIIIVTDKLSDLKKFHEDIFNNFGYYIESEEEKITYSYVLQAWNSEICQNSFVQKKSYNEAVRECNKECPYYDRCEINLQYFKQNKSPILLMSNIKFAKYKNQIERVKSFVDKDGNKMLRTIVLIDEKPEIIAPIKIDENFMSSLKAAATNARVDENNLEQCSQKSLIIRSVIDIEQKIASIHNEYLDKPTVYPVAGDPNKQLFSEEFLVYWEQLLKNKESDKLMALQRLLVTEGGLLHRTSNITYFNLLNRNDFRIDNMKTIIFDATAAIDPDYNDTESFVYISVDDYRNFNNVKIYNYKDINLSRAAFKSNKKNRKNKALAQWFNKSFKQGVGDIFVVTYQKQAEILTGLIKNSRVKYDVSTKTIAYFNNTKGKNNWRDCYTMVQFGWNNKDSNDYLARAYSRSINDYLQAWSLLREKPGIADELADNFKNKFGVFDNSVIAETYRHCHVAAEFEQEIFRTAMRKYGDNKPISIYVFNMNDTVRSLIWHRLNGTVKVEYIDGEFEEWIKEKSKIYNAGNETNQSKFLDWYRDWNEPEVSVTEIKKTLGISNTQWKDLKKKKEVKKILSELNYERRGNEHFYKKSA